MDNFQDGLPLDDTDGLSIVRSLGRIEQAVSTMASDIHDAVLAQKAITERLERDELRLHNLEGWRSGVRDRNALIGKIGLALLLPALAGLWSGAAYITKLTQDFHLHERLYHHAAKK